MDNQKKNKLKKELLILATVLSSIIYLTWRIFFTIPFEYGILSTILGVLLLIVEVIGMFEAIVHYQQMSNIVYPEKPIVEDEKFPHVDVFIATYNEPVDLIYKTINGCINMDYPEKSKVHVYLCDDLNRSEMKSLADSMGINYVTREENTYAKAGNLNNAMKYSSSPIILTLDADMIPKHDFLISCVPYFMGEEKIGFIQTPQSFYNPDLFQYNLFSENRIPNEQDYFYRDVQVSKNKTNSVIYGGTNTLISREALEEIGGFFTGVITEDFATGIQIQSKGYKCYALDEIYASGLSPSDLKSLIKQRKRWARGCIQTGRKVNILFKKGLNLKQKISYISSISYWYSGLKRFMYIISPIMFSTFGIMVVKCSFIEVLIFWLPMYLFSDLSLKYLSNNIRSTKWTNIYETILFMALIPSVVLETFGLSEKKFEVTKKNKDKDNDKLYNFIQAIPHMILSILTTIGIGNCVMATFEQNTVTYVVILFWLCTNLYNLLMSIFFMLGRKAYRNYERIHVETSCTISYDNKTINCVTNDISEGGMATILDLPVYIPQDKLVTINIYTDVYRTEFKAKVVHVDNIKDKWKYAFTLKEIKENDKRNLYHILYDREPIMPKNLDDNLSSFDDIRINLLKRYKKGTSFNRRLARIDVDKKLKSLEQGHIKLLNYNYEYAAIQALHSISLPENITVQVNDDIYLKCVEGKEIDYGKTNKKNDTNRNCIKLYRVENYNQLVKNEEFISIVYSWNNYFNTDRAKQLINIDMQTNSVKHSLEFDEMNYI
ncbi:glycosyltransferase [Romboutsia ilealis]|uniref:cellulose synthase (UDP-forming) n=1 Tax=Romboutsia faecis TaxID=2764597 RepID=A0ABR7JPK4_9FIRM|nr:glycosyltransferase family 2 protein [Romboutsia faecis]MBC5996839.1 glycosyltransferase [Romboutsia faecis]MRN24655.1 glycosyltransferase [Romboutsia ilealis]